MGAGTVCDCAAYCLHKKHSTLILVIKWKLSRLDLEARIHFCENGWFIKSGTGR
jgi:hypothetical protein